MFFNPADQLVLISLQSKIKILEDNNLKLDAERLRFKSYHDMAFDHAKYYKDQLETFEKKLIERDFLYQETRDLNDRKLRQHTNELKLREAYLEEVKQEFSEQQVAIDNLQKNLECKQEIQQREIDIYKSTIDVHLNRINELEKHSIDLEINYLRQLKLKDDSHKNEIKQFQARESLYKQLEDHIKQSYEMVKSLRSDGVFSVSEKILIDRRTPQPKTAMKDLSFSAKNINYLVRMFDECRYPSRETLAKIKINTNLEEVQIIKWFSNRRLRKH